MPKTKVELEINLPEGYEFVRYGTPKKGEWFMAHAANSTAVQSKLNWVSDFESNKRFILQPVAPPWDWPTWLKAPWIAMDKSGEWWGYEARPTVKGSYWGKRNEDVSDPYPKYDDIPFWMLDFIPPTCTDWTKSLMRNPHLPRE